MGETRGGSLPRLLAPAEDSAEAFGTQKPLAEALRSPHHSSVPEPGAGLAPAPTTSKQQCLPQGRSATGAHRSDASAQRVIAVSMFT
jgi:hypothetical protein